MTLPRIAHIAFNQVRKLPVLGAELRALRDEFEADLIVPSYDQHPEALREQLPDVRIRYVHLFSREYSARQTPMLKLLRFVEFTVKAMWQAWRSRAALLVGHDMPGMLPLLPWVLFAPRRVIFAAHELWTEAAEDNAPLRPVWRAVERYIVRRVERVVVPEENRARIMHEEYGARVLPAVVRNIPEHAPTIVRGDALHRLLGVDGDARLLLYQGLIAESRCLLELIDAVATLGPEVRLVLIGEGDGEYGRRVDEKMKALGGRGHRIGWTAPDELARLTASADVGVLLYRNNGRNNYYAAPNKLYEYLFAGLPVLASAFPGLTSVVEQGGYGVCADPQLPEAIAHSISAALNIPAGETIAMRAREQFRWDGEAEVLRCVYRKALAGRQRG